MADPDIQTVAQTAGAAIVVIAVTAVVLNQFAAVTMLSGFTSVDANTDNFSNVNSNVQEVPSSVDVSPTSERAVRLSTSTISADLPPFTQGDWSACTAASLSADANQDGTYNAFAYDNASVLVQYDAGNWRAYVTNGSHYATTTVPAPSPQDGFTPVCARYDDATDTVTLNASGNTSTSVLSTSRPARNVSESWNGRLDETRVWNRTLTDSETAGYASRPNLPITDDRVARFSFDEGSGPDTRVYFLNGTVSIGGASWTQGLTSPAAPASAYELSGTPFQIQLTDGGVLDGAPVVWVDYTSPFGGVLSQVFSVGAAALGLLIVGILVMAARAVVPSKGF